MTRIIAICNQKGGCSKTTSAINIAAGWARRAPEQRVLLVDIDPQANATAVVLGIPAAAGPRQADRPSIYDVLIERATVHECVRSIHLDDGTGARLDVLPSHLQLAYAEVELSGAFQREYRLQHALAPAAGSWDIIIIDCPPSLGLLTLNALMAANEVLIPVDPGVFPLIGLSLLRRTIEMVQRANPALRIAGVFPTLSDRTVLSRDTLTQLQGTFGATVLPGIPRRVAIGEAHAQGVDIFAYAPDSDGAAAYAALVEEIASRG